MFNPSIAEDNQYRLSTLNKSWHFSDKNYNENHNGLGLEYRYKKDWWLGVLFYKNSYSRQSTMLSINREYSFKKINVGWFVAGATGYHDSPVIAGATIRYKYIRLILNTELAAIGLVF